jgi:hypothetical protein
MDAEIPKQIRNQLEPGECVLWCDQPKQGFLLRKELWIAIPVLVIWYGMVIFLFMLTESLVPILLLLPSLYVWIYLFFLEPWIRSRTFYNLTNRRISVLWDAQLESISLDRIEEVTLEQSNDGTGTIRFGRESLHAREKGFSLFGPFIFMFERIKDAPHVAAEIRNAQNKLLNSPC